MLGVFIKKKSEQSAKKHFIQKCKIVVVGLKSSCSSFIFFGKQFQKKECYLRTHFLLLQWHYLS